MKEFGEQAAGTTALLYRWNEAWLRRRPHPASTLAACVVRCATVQDEIASSVSDETRCGGVLESLHTRSPFSTKQDMRCFVAVCFAVGLQRVRPSTTENAIPHMVAELWLRTPLH